MGKHSSRFRGFGFVFMILATLVILGFPSLTQNESGVIKIGDKMPALGFKKIIQSSGESVPSVNSLNGQVVVLEFFATWCGSCMPGIKHLNELADKFQDQPLTLITVDSPSAPESTPPRSVGWLWSRCGRG